MTGRELKMTPTREALERLREAYEQRWVRWVNGVPAPSFVQGVRSDDLSLALGLLDRAAKVLEPFVRPWNETALSLPPNYPEGQLADLARRGLQPEAFQDAASLLSDLAPDSRE